jgi:hypothetical protein
MQTTIAKPKDDPTVELVDGLRLVVVGYRRADLVNSQDAF